ncbi:hypothetical protein NQ649_12795 [Acinetobacter baumannii]|nr:hypothetical protein [Acinetobacter baumannii]
MSSTNRHETVTDVINTQFNPSLQPIYADQVFQIAIENNIVKLMLGHKVNQNTAVHSATVALPMSGLLSLIDTLNNIFDNPDFRNNYIQDVEKLTQDLKQRFNSSSE